ncbi:hypothetical protein UlMin_007277 [Ulmus minor]
MAEANPATVANRILETLDSLPAQEIGWLNGVAGELEKLKDEVSRLRGVLNDATMRAGESPEDRDWLNEVADVLFDGDEIVDELRTEKVWLSVSRQFLFRLKKGRKLVRVTKKLAELVEKDRSFNRFRLAVIASVAARAREIISTRPFGEEVYFGTDRDKEALMQFLLDYYETVSVISIVGLRGLGKTTLTKLVFRDARVKTHFVLRLWVNVSGDFDLIRIADDIIKSATGRSVENPEIELEKQVAGRSFILVLDDVRDIDRDRWFAFKRLLMGGAEGSKVLITTRSDMVATITGTIPSYRLIGLSVEDSSALFNHVVFYDGYLESPVVKQVAKEVVRKCNGNPLTIKTIGNILRSKNTPDEWVCFYYNGLHLQTNQDDDIPPELKLSYNDLPPHLKDCFAYCSLFPKNYEIDVSTLNKFWVAQGFTMNNGNSTRLLEEIGSQYFEDLVSRGFFKIVETTGNARKCKMAEAVLDDLAELAAGKECLKLDLGGQYIFVRKRIHHVSFDFPLPLLRGILTNLEPVKSIRSLVFFPNQQSGKYKESSNQAICDAIVSNFKSLRTLDLHHSGIKTVPSYIDSLKHLRYLDLSGNAKIKVLPNSITKLLNLQTLKLSSCFTLQELPRDMKKLVKLRHLEIDGCYNLTHMPSGMGELRDLQTLSQFVLSKEANSVPGHSGALRELGTLNNLRGDLQIRNLRHDHDVRDICLKEKQGLQSLTLHWSVGAMGLDDEKLLEGGLGEHINLQRLAFKGYGGAKLPNWLSTSQYLVKLELRRCSECTFLPPLHCCPSLETLALDDMTKLEYVAEDHVVKDFFFPCLKELRLTELPMLKGWWKSTSPEVNHEVPVFPILSKLFIEDCPQLDSMPLFPNLDEGLVLDSTSWKPFQQTMNKADHASSSSSSSSSPLSDLRNLSIIGIEELNTDDVSEIKWERLARLQFLRLDYLPNLESLPDGLQSITSLQELHIWRCNFTAIPDWISELKSLKKLSIWVCPNMESLPETIRSMNSLLTLEIEDCPTLLHRCQRKAGADWVKISGIPDLRLDRMSRR